jgi:AraC family transcriptional regulator
MNSNSGPALPPPVIVDGEPLLLAGLSQSYTAETTAGIPAQWQRFVPHIGAIAGQQGDTTFGVCTDGDDAGNMNYLCAVEVSRDSDLATELTSMRIPAQRYAVFKHTGHISTIRQTWASIWNSALPASGYKASGGPMFERYGAMFDPRTGNGGLEIWIPVRDRE